MRLDDHIDRYLARFPALASVCYFAVVLLLAFFTWSASADLYERTQALGAARDLLDQLDRGRQNSAALSPLAGSTPAGSPFLEGQTVTVAGAALLQRVAGAVTRVSGSVLSSQVDVQGTQSKAGLVSLMASCEIAQPELQKLLYDLEAGMPYLFVDQLVVQAPETVTRGEGGRLRVVLGVSGQWQGTK